MLKEGIDPCLPKRVKQDLPNIKNINNRLNLFVLRGIFAKKIIRFLYTIIQFSLDFVHFQYSLITFLEQRMSFIIICHILCMYYYCCCYFMSYNLYVNIVFILLYPVVLKIYVTTGIGASYFVLAFLYSFLLEKKNDFENYVSRSAVFCVSLKSNKICCKIYSSKSSFLQQSQQFLYLIFKIKKRIVVSFLKHIQS